MKESHDYYVNRLTEGYKHQLETMEQSYEDQIRELKTQFASSLEKTKKDSIEETAAEGAEKLKAVEKQLKEKTEKFEKLRAEFASGLNRESRAEKKYARLVSSHRADIDELRKEHEAELEEAQRENSSGPYQWIEIKLRKRFKSRIATPKVVVKRSGIKFSEMVQAGLNSKSTDSWGFEYKGRPLTDTGKTLMQVS